MGRGLADSIVRGIKGHHMTDPLTNAVDNYAQAYADSTGIARTPIADLTIIRATAPAGLNGAIRNPPGMKNEFATKEQFFTPWWAYWQQGSSGICKSGALP